MIIGLAHLSLVHLSQSQNPQVVDFLVSTLNSEVTRSKLKTQAGSREETIRLSQELSVRLANVDFTKLKGLSLSEVSHKLGEELGRFIRTSNSPISSRLRERLLAQTICDFVRLTVSYDKELELDLNRLASRSDLTDFIQLSKARKDPLNILKMQSPSAVCTGISLLTRNLARLSGLSCYYINGFTRSSGKTGSPNHVWNVFVYSDGSEQPADNTRALVKGEFPGKLGRSFLVLPETDIEWAAFTAACHGYNPKTDTSQGDAQNKFLLTTLSFNDWFSLDTSVLNKYFPMTPVFSRPKRRAANVGGLIVVWRATVWAGLSCVALRSDPCVERSDAGRNQWNLVD